MNKNFINRTFKTRISPIVGSSLLVLSLSACSSVNGNYSRRTADTSVVEETDNLRIDSYYISPIRRGLGLDKNKKIKKKDLLKLNEISLIVDECDLSWLNYCNNLTKLEMSIYRDSNLNFSEIDEIFCLETIVLRPYSSGYSFDEKNYGFLLKCNNLKTLHLAGFDFIDENFINKLESVSEIVIECDDRVSSSTVNSNIDFSKLKNLNKVRFINVGLYDAAVYLDNKDLDMLADKGVVIDFGDTFTMEQLRDVNNELDEIVNGLDIVDDMDDEEKLDKILEYVLNRLSYSKEAIEANKEGKGYLVNATMYIDGFLYAIFNSDSAVCGNYAAFFQALANRINLESFFMTSNVHAWNLVNIDNEYYYVDATRLDYLKVEVDGEEGMFLDFYRKQDDRYKKIPWYMEALDDAKKDDNAKSHIPMGTPSFIDAAFVKYNYDEINSYTTLDNLSSIDLTNKIIVVNNKYKLDSKTFIYLLIGLGLAKKGFNLNKKKNKKR